MKTKVIHDDISEAAEIIKNGGIVAVPTETVYGLACNGLNETAVGDIYEVKGRPAVKPLALMIYGTEDIEKYCTDIPVQAYVLAKKYWPGPVTIILKRKQFIPQIVVAGGNTVGLRCPDSPLTLKLINEAGVPLAAPSANPSGLESAISAEGVLEYFNGKIPAVIDGGICNLKVASTIVNMASTPYKILREGIVSAEEIATVLVENMKIIGITGGSGCGKTTALRTLEEYGALIIDCDKLYHDMLSEDVNLIQQIKKRFPDAVENGVVDRKKLGESVFRDEIKLKCLNEITHKLIIEKIMSMLKEAAMEGYTAAAVDAVELFSSGLSDICDFTLSVTAPESMRLERISIRDNIDLERAKLRIGAQKPDSYYEENADCCICNNGTEEQFILKCRKVFTEVLS